MQAKYIYVQGVDYRGKPTHFMARKMVNRDPHYVIVAKFTNEAEAQTAVVARNEKEDDRRGAFVRGEAENV